MCDSGHALPHASSFELGVKDSTRILIAAIRMKQRRSVRVLGYSLIKHIENQCVVVRVADGVSDDSSIV